MAVIKNQKTGMWEVRTYYKDWTGERKQKTKRGFAKKSEALEWERNFKLKEDQSISMTFGSFVEIYLNTKLQEGVQVRKQSIAKTFRYMRGLKKDPQMIPASKENVEAIKCLYESNEWINDLLVVFEN